MKLKILILLIALNSFQLSFSQTTFNYVFHSPLSNDYVADIAEDDGNYYAIGGNCAEDICGGRIYKINAAADTITKAFYFGDTSCVFSNLIIENDKITIVSIISTAPEYYDDLMILVFDTNLNYISKKIINLPNMENTETWRFKKHLNSYYVLTTTQGPSSFPPNVGDPYFIKLNSQLDTIRTSLFRIEGPQRIGDYIFSKDGSELYLFSSLYFQLPNLDVSDEFIVYDTSFNLKYWKEFPDGIPTFAHDVEWIDDTTFLIASNHFYPSDDQWFRQMDTSLTVYNQSHVGDPTLLDYGGAEKTIDFITKDSIYFVGVKNVIAEFYPREYSWIRAGLLNSQLQVIFERFYGGDAYYNTRMIKRTSDGGFLISSQRFDYLTQQYNEWDVCLLKLNSEGLITNTASHETNYHSFIVYPNPARDFITIESTELQQGTIKILDCAGNIKLITNYSNGKTSINISNLAKGVYFITLDNSQLNQHYKFIKN